MQLRPPLSEGFGYLPTLADSEILAREVAFHPESIGQIDFVALVCRRCSVPCWERSSRLEYLTCCLFRRHTNALRHRKTWLSSFALVLVVIGACTRHSANVTISGRHLADTYEGVALRGEVEKVKQWHEARSKRVQVAEKFGAPGEIRTPDPLVRRAL